MSPIEAIQKTARARWMRPATKKPARHQCDGVGGSIIFDRELGQWRWNACRRSKAFDGGVASTRKEALQLMAASLDEAIGLALS